MRDKLVQLGAAPAPLPPLLPSDTLENIIAARLRDLRIEERP
jgi:hypothetical protein